MIGFISGCFDGFHQGHRFIINKAQDECSKLFIAINDDDYVLRKKGRKPMQSLYSRCANLSRVIRPQDVIIPFREDTPLQLILKLKPDIIFVGSDYKIENVIGASECLNWGGRVEIIQRIPGSSTEIYEKSFNS